MTGIMVWRYTRGSKRPSQQDDVRDGVVDGEEGYDEACQEEEDGDVKKGRDGLNGDGHLEAAHTLGKERSDVGTFMDLRPEAASVGGIGEPSVAGVLRVERKKEI